MTRDEVAASFAALPAPGALVFDLDGTLVDTVEARIRGWLATFGEEGIPAERGSVAPLIGSDGKRLAREIASASGRELSPEEQERIDARAGELYDAFNVAPRPLRGARELLLALSRSTLPWAIATSSRAAQVLASVRALDLPAPPPIVDGSSVSRAKPDPELLLVTAERLGVPAPGTWYVGDATWDMLAARAAGMPGIGVVSGVVAPEALRESGARVTLDSLQPLHAELRRRGVVD